MGRLNFDHVAAVCSARSSNEKYSADARMVVKCVRGVFTFEERQREGNSKNEMTRRVCV